VQFPQVRGIGWAFLDATLEGVQDASAQFLPGPFHVARCEVGEHFFMQFFGDVGELPGMRTGSADLPPEDSVSRILGVNRASYRETGSGLYLQHHIFRSLKPSRPLQLQPPSPIRPPTRSLLSKRHNESLRQQTQIFRYLPTPHRLVRRCNPLHMHRRLRGLLLLARFHLSSEACGALL
jgi:hypothetical protein